MLGHIYSAPYAVLSPETVFIAEDSAGPAGFVLGAPDTLAFEDRLERDWWPALRQRYPQPAGPPEAWDHDARRCHRIHAPRRTPPRIFNAFPAHLHLNLLPRMQGRGWGRALLERWIDAIRPGGLHVGVNPDNQRAIGFWQASGFHNLAPSEGVVWLGRAA
nr:GNAT family N-acetyltransferase [Falsiroseomonas tokyonensis]